jgi:tRNA 2-selenouridine synthase SelU
MRTTAQVVIGYMYKVLKNGKDTSKFRSEFAAIRHGDYDEFLNLIGKEIDFIVTYNSGAINNDTNIRNDDSDFGRLIKSEESLKSFYNNCFKEYGKIDDQALSDEDS